MNKYDWRLLSAVCWIAFFILAGIVDYIISLNDNDLTLSKIILWAFNKDAVVLVGLVFMTGYLFGHLLSPQDPLSPNDK